MQAPFEELRKRKNDLLRNHLQAVRREHHLGFALIPDPDRRIARQYRVNCWPTIVSINELGLVDLVHSGITHNREVAPEYSPEDAQ